MGSRTAQEWLDLVFPGETRRQQEIKASRMLRVSPGAVEKWKDSVPRCTEIVFELYIGEMDISDLEDIAHGERKLV